MSMAEQQTYPCPYCLKRPIQTVRQVPVFRGYIVVFQHGSRRFAGCVRCVRRRMLGECVKAVTFGWVSPKALIATVFVTPVTFMRALLCRKGPTGVAVIAREIEAQQVRTAEQVRDAMYTVAGAVIRMGGSHPAQFETAAEYLEELAGEFDPEKLERCMELQNREDFLVHARVKLFMHCVNEVLMRLLEMMEETIVAGGAMDEVTHQEQRKNWIDFANRFGLSEQEAERRWEALVPRAAEARMG